MDATVLIATYNRAVLLDRTLVSLQSMQVSPTFSWEAIVVDNNSTDDTRAVVERHRSTFPVPLGYLLERHPGRSSALNTGIAEATGRVIVFTDDDVVVCGGWVEAASRPILEDPTIAYTGGPVRPLWEVPPPAWLDLERCDLWGTIAIQNHGDEPFVYEERRKVPLGANMAVRRDLFGHIGGFRPDLGRTSGRLVLGQEVPELLMRARAAGARGLYVPGMVVDHHVAARRLEKRYFRTWWFGKGVSRAALDRLHTRTELGVDLRSTPHVLGVPRFMYGTALRDLLGSVVGRLSQRPEGSFRHEAMLAYFAGYFWARQRERGQAGVRRGSDGGQTRV